MRKIILVAALALVGCGAMPVSSMMALSRLDLVTTDLASLQAGVTMPDTLRPLPGTVRLMVRVTAPGAERDGVFLLEPDAAASARARLDLPPGPGRRTLAFRLTAPSLADLAAFRQAAASRSGARMTIGVAADACRNGPIMAGPIAITTLLRTQQTGRFVVLAQLDLRHLVSTDAIAALPACDATPDEAT